MSKRENIASDIITKLDAVTSPIEFKKITREPFEVEELSDAQFPALFVQSGDETREVSSIGDTGAGSYRGTIDFLIVAFGKGTDTNIDTIRNQIIEVVEESRKDKLNKNSGIELFSGEFWSGNKAKELGLVDEIGNINQVLKQKFGKDVIVKKFEKPKSWISKKFSSSEESVEKIASILEERSIWQRYGL